MTNPNGAPPSSVLAVLTADERQAVAQAETLVRTHQLLVVQLQRGLVGLWREIRDRHGLPAAFKYDLATGLIYPKPEPVLEAGEPPRG